MTWLTTDFFKSFHGLLRVSSLSICHFQSSRRWGYDVFWGTVASASEILLFLDSCFGLSFHGRNQTTGYEYEYMCIYICEICQKPANHTVHCGPLAWNRVIQVTELLQISGSSDRISGGASNSCPFRLWWPAQDIFAGLISLIFIIDGVRPIIANFADGVMPLTNCFFEALLFIYTFGLATYLSGMRRTPWMLRPLRNLLANFSVTIALISASALAAIYASDVSLRMLQVDAEFAPNLELASGEKRPWVVNPAGIETEFPAWGIAFAIVPAIGFAVLGYLDQNLTSVIVNRPSNGLKKGPGYHLDLFVRGAITLPVCAVLGLPLSVASTVPSITHVTRFHSLWDFWKWNGTGTAKTSFWFILSYILSLLCRDTM